jgi:hypothetical protein
MATGPIDADGRRPFERVPTGIPDLDSVFARKLSQAVIYMVGGDPGTGKTSGWCIATIGYSRVSFRNEKNGFQIGEPVSLQLRSDAQSPRLNVRLPAN